MHCSNAAGVEPKGRKREIQSFGMEAAFCFSARLYKDCMRLIIRASLFTLLGIHAVSAQNVCSGVRIDYEASIASAAIAMAPWSEVQRNFPQAKGITEQTVFVTRDRLVEIQRGVGLKVSVSNDVRTPAPGVHFRNEHGKDVTFVGYTQAPLHILKIETADEKIVYNSLLGEARRSSRSARDRDTAAALIGLSAAEPTIGEREYAGMRCSVKRIPKHEGAEACVTQIEGRNVALYLKYDVPEFGGMQGYRATRITSDTCMKTSELSIPSDVPVKDARRKSTARAGDE
jgi:hypothetical protein